MITREAKDAFADQQTLLRGQPVRTVFDVGAHNGLIASRYRDLFPEATIYCFEPFAEMFGKLRERFEGDGLAQPYQLALSNQTGRMGFYANRDYATNSLLPSAREAERWVTPYSAIETMAQTEVAVTTVDSFCREYGIDEIQILKVDTQGAELRVLEGAREKLRRGRVGIVFVEIVFVPVYEGQGYFHQVADFLFQHGYTLYDMYHLVYAEDGNVKWGDGLFLSPQLRSRQLQNPARAATVCAGVAGLQPTDPTSKEQEMAQLHAQVAAQQAEITALRKSLEVHGKQFESVALERQALVTFKQAVEASAGWRALNRWRRLRDSLAPEGTARRRWYDALLKGFRGRR